MKFFRLSAVLALIAGCALAPAAIHRATAADAPKMTCPITGETFTDSADHQGVIVDGKRVAFCCGGCPSKFQANPDKYVTTAMLGKCPVMGGPNKVNGGRLVVNNQIQYFCCPGCVNTYKADPSKYTKTLTDVVSKKDFTPTTDSPRSEYSGQLYVFSSADSKATFDKDPATYAVVFGPKP